MSNVDDAAKTVSPQAHLVGLWLAKNHIKSISPNFGMQLLKNHIKSISPNFGMQLLEVAAACQEHLVSETDRVIVLDVSRFISALRLVAGAALVHDAAILDVMVNAVRLAQKEEEPHV